MVHPSTSGHVSQTNLLKKCEKTKKPKEKKQNRENMSAEFKREMPKKKTDNMMASLQSKSGSNYSSCNKYYSKIVIMNITFRALEPSKTKLTLYIRLQFKTDSQAAGRQFRSQCKTSESWSYPSRFTELGGTLIGGLLP